MTISTVEQLQQRIAQLETENKALNERTVALKARAFPLPDPGQLSQHQYRGIVSELVGTGLFTDLGGGRLWPCWCRLENDGSLPEWARRRHYDNMRRFLGK